MKLYKSIITDEITAITKYFHMWSLLGWYDIKQRYRRSMIGPFWITISTGIMIGSIGLIFSKIFKSSIAEFLPYFATGQIIWLLLSAQLTDACTMFIQSQSIIKQVSLPLSVHVLRKLWYNIILFLHNFLIIIILLIAARKGFLWEYLLVIPAVVLILTLLFLLSMILGIICTRFRDITQIVAVFLQLIYFFTPIFWMKKSLATKQSWITDLNPFYHIIELVRSPLLGKNPDVYHWLNLLMYVILAAVITFFLMKRFRNRVAYWL